MIGDEAIGGLLSFVLNSLARFLRWWLRDYAPPDTRTCYQVQLPATLLRPGICVLLQCGRGLIVYVCAALDRGVGADCPEWIFCCRRVFAGGGQNIAGAAVGRQGQSACARGRNSGGRSASGGFRGTAGDYALQFSYWGSG